MILKTTNNDLIILRELAKLYIDICNNPDQQRRRRLWRELNGLQSTSPAIYIRAYAWNEMPQSKCQCRDPLLLEYEEFFRKAIFLDTVKDDSIFEPWVTVQAEHMLPPQGIWGLPVVWHGKEGGGAGKLESPLSELADIDKLVEPNHQIDEAATAKKLELIQEAIGDIVPVIVDRAPIWRMWHGEISTDLGQLRGLEQILWDMVDQPQWLHQLLAFMRDGILKTHAQAEKAGDWRLCDHQNQAMTYSSDLPDPSLSKNPAVRKQLWYYCASQEFTLVGPEMWNEFMLQYQLPIMQQFGLAAYGCCENLTQKISLLRQIPNLRRIAVSPFADVQKCAEQIGRDYVMSYRPSPAEMVSRDFDEQKIRDMLRRDFSILRGCYFDITLKDVETVQSDPNRIAKWVKIVREILDEMNI